MRYRCFAFLLVVTLIVAGVAQSAPSRVEIVARGPQAQQPDTSSADDDPGKGGTQINPSAGQTRGFPADVIVYDANGHNDISRVNVTVLRSDNVTVHQSGIEATKLSGGGTRATYRATVTMASDDEPGLYILRAAALDRDAAVTFAWTNFSYEPLAALTLDRESVSLAPAGSTGFEPGSDTTETPIEVDVTNGGNVDVDLTLAASALSNATYQASMPPSSLLASRSSNMSSALALETTAGTLTGPSISPNATAALYIGVQVPAGLRPGDYVGELTVGAVAAS